MATISFRSTELFDHVALLTLIQNWNHIDIPNDGKDTWEINDKIFVPLTILTNYIKKANISDNNNIAEVPVTYKYSHH